MILDMALVCSPWPFLQLRFVLKAALHFTNDFTRDRHFGRMLLQGIPGFRDEQKLLHSGELFELRKAIKNHDV